jgi:hypothetical protein
VPAVFRLKSIPILGGLLLISSLLGCGKPLQRPVLSGPPSAPVDHLILGRELSAKDLRELFKILNQKGEFNSLAQWIGTLSDAELSAWGQFLNEWVYQDALSSKGLIQLVKVRVQGQGFSLWKKNLQKLGPALPQMFEDEELWSLLPRVAGTLDPHFVNGVLKPLGAAADKTLLVPEKPEVNTGKIWEEFFQLLGNEPTRLKLQDLIQSVGDLQWVAPLAEASRENLNASGETWFSQLAKDFSEKRSFVNQALRLAELLNRPAERAVTVLQEGLRSNPDIVHALTMRWDPIFVKSLSELVRQVLLKPEDGSRLDREFWLALPRGDVGAPPTQEFIRLYSVLYSGIQKISDPRRIEPQVDSGSYRLPLQLNALFLTRLLEEAVRQLAPKIKEMNPESFEETIWKSPVLIKEFRLNLIKDESQNEVSESVQRDLRSLGLLTTLSRLESLVREQDSGKNNYSVTFSSETLSLTEGFSEAVASAHAVRPFADITPFLVTLVQSLIGTHSESGLGLEFLKSSPNLLAQGQGFLAQMDSKQWQQLRKLLFEDLKIGALEMEDRALLVSLFQSDLEVAEWVNEILMNVQSVYALDGLFSFYHSFIRKLGAPELSNLGTTLSILSELSLFKESEEGVPVNPGFQSLLLNGNRLSKGVRGFAGLSAVQARLLQGKLNEVLGEDLEGQKGSDLLFGVLTRLTERVSPETVSGFTQRLFETEWRITDSESQWISDFSKKKGFSELHELLKSRKNQVSVLDLMNEVRVLSEKKVVDEGMRLLAKIQNERMKEIALVILEMDRSGELFSLLDSVPLIFKKGETP